MQLTESQKGTPTQNFWRRMLRSTPLLLLILLLSTPALAAFNDSIVGCWEMEEASGDLVDDINGYNMNVTGGSPTYQVAGAVGSYGVTYDATGEYHSTPSVTDLVMGAGNFSVCAWFKSLDNTGDNLPLGKDSYNANPYEGFYFYRPPANDYVRFVLRDSDAGCDEEPQSTSRMDTEAGWVFICGVRRGDNAELWFNASIQDNHTGASSCLLDTTNTYLSFGRSDQQTNHDADTSVDQVMIWKDYSLSADDISNLWNSGSGQDCDYILNVSTPAAEYYSDFTVSVTDLYDDSNLQGVNVTLGGTSNTTDASGNAVFYNLSGAQNYNATLSGFYSVSGTVQENGTSDANMSSANYTINTVTTKVTGAQLSAPFNYTVVSKGYTSDPIYLKDGLMNVSWNKTGYYVKTESFNVTGSPTTGTFSVTDVYDNQHTIFVQAVNGTTITDSTFIQVNNTVHNFIENCTSTSGNCTFNLTQGVDYTFLIQPTGYEYKNLTMNPGNSSSSNTTSHYLKNTINISFYDEETGALISSKTIILEMISDAMSDNYTITTGTIITDILSPDTYTLRYAAAGYMNGFYEFTIVDNYHYNLNLTMLNATSGDNVTIYVYDTIGNRLESAQIQVLKYDVTTNSYTVVEVLRTNFEGRAVANIILNNEFYKFITSYGNTTSTTAPTYIYGTEITLYLSIGTQGFEDYFSKADISGTLTHSYTSHTSTFTYSDGDSIATQGCVQVYRGSSASWNLINSSCSASAASTVFVGMANTSGVHYIVKGIVTKGGNDYTISTLIVSYAEDNPETGLGLFLVAIITVIMVMVGFWSLPVAVILGGFIPLLAAISGLANISLTVAVPLFGLSLILAYIVGGRT